MRTLSIFFTYVLGFLVIVVLPILFITGVVQVSMVTNLFEIENIATERGSEENEAMAVEAFKDFRFSDSEDVMQANAIEFSTFCAGIQHAARLCYPFDKKKIESGKNGHQVLRELHNFWMGIEQKDYISAAESVEKAAKIDPGPLSVRMYNLAIQGFIKRKVIAL